MRTVGSPGSFSVAVRAPFSRAAEGARLPDGNPNLSATLALTQKFALQTDADGNLDTVVLPGLYTSAFTTRGSIVGGVNLALASATTTANTLNGPTVAVNTAEGIGFAVNTLAGQYARYRIVSYGARLRTTTGVTTTGEFTCAVMPLKGQAPQLSSGYPAVIDGAATAQDSNSYWGSYGPRNTLDNLLIHLGLPYSGSGNTAQLDIPKLVNTPCHAVASASQVAARGLHMRGLPFEASARDYRTMTFSSYGTDSLDVATSAGSAAGATYAVQQVGVDMSFARVGGHESIVLGGTGFPVSSTVGSLELVYHVEAITNPAYAVLARPTGVVPRVAPGQTLDQVLTSIHRIPRVSFADVLQTAGDAMMGEIEGQAGAAMGRAASGIGGMLTRLLTIGA
jgi:hypothetical protein